MSRHWLLHSAVALICGLTPLIPAAPVQASSLSSVKTPAASAAPESAVLTKFRDSGPPVMERAAQLEATAPDRALAFATTTAVKTQPVSAVTNPRLFREVFGFAFASSLGDPTIGYQSSNFSLLSTVAYFGIHVDWTGDFSGGSALNNWNDTSGPVPAFIRTAHASGTKVVLTIAMFDSTSGTPNVCSALQRYHLTIQRTLAEAKAKGAYLGFFDIPALANYIDYFFVMAYDMEYANWDSPPLSCPSFCLGPTAPLSTYQFNDGRASSEYRAVVPASKIILGIPYYGRKE